MTLNKFSLAVILVFTVLLAYTFWPHTNSPVVSHPLPNIERVEVEKITEKVVKEFVQDPAQLAIIKAQAEQIKQLKGEVRELTSTIARAESAGGVGVNGGGITLLPPTTMVIERTPEVREQTFSFKDYQLEALYTSTGSRFTYGLQQDFIITTTTGKDSRGHRTTLVDLSQKTPSGSVHIHTKTTELFARENPPSWFLSPRIQGGVGIDTTGAKFGLVALQWLRRGTSSAAEDTRFSILSPALSSRGLTLLPVSVNLGQIKHNPLTNLWISPTIDLNKSIGLAVTATF